MDGLTPTMDTSELDRLAASLPRKSLDNPALLVEVGERLGVEWPEDYVRLISQHNGVSGDIGDWYLVLSSVEDLPGDNDPAVMEFFPGLVMIGGDGGGEALLLDRATGEVILAPLVGGPEDGLVLGSNLVEALQRMERDEVFDAPHREAGG
jgi:hypothetical protein